MSRVAPLLIVLLAVPWPAWADGSGPLETRGMQLARDVGRRQGAQPPSLVPPRIAHRAALARASRDAQDPGLSGSGMSRGKKLAIGIGLAVAFGAAVWAIDQGVEDNTPSSRGLR